MKRLVQHLQKVNDSIQGHTFTDAQSYEKFLDRVRYDFLEKIFKNPEANAFYEKSFLYHAHLQSQRSFRALMKGLFDSIQKLGRILFKQEFLERTHGGLGTEKRLHSPFRPKIEEDITIEQFAVACGQRELFLKLGEVPLFYPDHDIPGHPTSAILKQHQDISYILSRINSANRKFLSKRQGTEVEKLTIILNSQIRQLEDLLIDEPKRLHSMEFWYLRHFIYLCRNLGTPLGLRIFPTGLIDASKIKEAVQIVLDDLDFFSESQDVTKSLQLESQTTVKNIDSENSEGFMRYRDIGYDLQRGEAWLLTDRSRKIVRGFSTTEKGKKYGENLFKLLENIGMPLIDAHDKKNLATALSENLGIDRARQKEYFFNKNVKYGFSKLIKIDR